MRIGRALVRYNKCTMAEQDGALRWSAYEHEHVERGNDWFWALGIVAVCIAVISILFHDVLFAVLILLAAGILGLLANTPPDLVEFDISDRGIKVGDTLHRYEEILAFWINEEKGPHPLLLIDTTKFMAPNLIIPIHDIEPERIRDFLRERVPEIAMREPIGHRVLEFLGL